MENVVLDPGNTYFQDKMHVLRDIRRDYEIDSKAIETMSNFLISLKNRTNDITSLINKLQKLKNAKKEDPAYIPNVDVNMINKYDWAKPSNLGPKIVHKPLLVSNNKFNMKKGNPTFRATCYLSGNGVGTFKFWDKTYSYNTLEEATRAAKIDLDEIKSKNGGLLISDFQIHKIS